MPTIGATSKRSAAATGSSHCQPAPQKLALYLKALETRRSHSPEGLGAGTTGLALPTLRRRLAAIASRHATLTLPRETIVGAPVALSRNTVICPLPVQAIRCEDWSRSHWSTRA